MLLWSDSASACVCALLPNPTPEQVEAQFTHELKEARIVFSGEVTHLDRFKVSFKIERVWKGEAREEITIAAM